MGKRHDRRFPGETAAYRETRDQLLAAEMSLRQAIEDVAALRRRLPLGGRVEEDYSFSEIDAASGDLREVRLSELFEGDRDSLIVYGFMYGPEWDGPCPMCTAMIDSADGAARHLRQRTGFVVVAKARPDRLARLARERGWTGVRLLSSFGNRFNQDYLAQPADEPDEQNPMMNVFVRRDDGIYHFWGSEMFFAPMEGGHPRHVDLVWPLWNFLDLTPGGRGDFMPKLRY